MKAYFIIFFFGITLALAGNSYSQETRLSLNLENSTLKEVFDKIQEQSEFIIFYKDNMINIDRKVSINAVDKNIEQILGVLLSDLNLDYKIIDRQIVITSAKRKIQPRGVEFIEQQKIKVEGKVTDGSGNVIPGASVTVKGTTIGTITSIDGEYTISVPNKSSVLIISFIGMKTQEVPVNEKTLINVILEEETIGIDEIVAVGYGTMTKRDLTGSVVSVRSDQISQTLSTTVEQSLIGRASGVQVTQSEGAPGAGVKIRVRGGTSINASNEPLYVIDGFPVESRTNSVSAGFSSISGTSVLATMNPNDIESIEILKDASATAIYGSRGANGVVLITTKSGSGKKQNISFSAYYGIASAAKKLDVLDGDDYIQYFYDVIGGSFAGASKADYAARDENNDPIVLHVNEKGNKIYEVWPASRFVENDWQDIIFRDAEVQDYNLSFSGGSKNTNYHASVGYYNQEGIVIGSNYERYTGSIKLHNNFSEKFSADVNLNTGYTINDGVLSATSYGKGGSGVINNMIYFRPVFGYDDEGKQIVTMPTDRSDELTNPLKLATEQENLSKNYYIRSNISLNYEILPGLTFSSKLGVNLTNSKVKSWYPGGFGRGKSIGGGFAVLSSGNGISWLNDNLITYIKTFDDHKINAVFGFSQEGLENESFMLAKSGFEIQSINVDNIGSGTTFQANYNQSGRQSSNLRSWLGRFNYTFKEKYLLTFTGRADGSSKFATDNKWAFFPSAAFAWRATEEPFFDGIDEIDDFKLHVSYGKSGNQGIEAYASLPQYNFIEYSYSYQLVKGLRATRLQNKTLTWETTKQLDLGADLTMFDSRFSLNAVYYNKLTDDLLMEASVPFTTGFESAWKNTGSIKNYGMEFTLNTVNVETKDFTWTSNLNISFNKNMVKKLNSDLDYFYVSGPGPGELGDTYIVKVGEEIGSMFGYVWDGVYQIDEFDYSESLTDLERRISHPLLGGYKIKEDVVTREGVSVLPGSIKFKDIAGAPDEDGNSTGPDGTVDANDRTIIGNANPKHYGGFSNNFQYKNFDLAILLNWSYGNDIYNKNLVENTSMLTPYHNQLARVLDRWTPENPTNELWGVSGGSTESNSYYIEDGSFLRLSNITLGYNLPKEIIKKWNISNARIYVSGDNLHVWTNYSGFDPEVSVGIASSANPEYGLTPGIDYGAYPRSRTFRLGIKLDF